MVCYADLVHARQWPPMRKVLAIRALLTWPVLSSQALLDILTRLVSHSFPLKHLPCVGVKSRRVLGSWVNTVALNPLTAVLMRWRRCQQRGLADTKAPWWQAYPSPVWTVRAANRVHLDLQNKNQWRMLLFLSEGGFPCLAASYNIPWLVNFPVSSVPRILLWLP